MSKLKNIEKLFNNHKVDFKEITGLDADKNVQTYIQFLILEMVDTVDSKMSSVESSIDDVIKLIEKPGK